MLMELLFKVMTRILDWTKVLRLKWLFHDFILLLLFQLIPSRIRGLLGVMCCWNMILAFSVLCASRESGKHRLKNLM